MINPDRPKGFPMIHLNGTSAETLAHQYDEAYAALIEAQEKLAETAPNQRDYYPLADEEWQAALAAHAARMDAIQRVLDELSELASYCWLNSLPPIKKL